MPDAFPAVTVPSFLNVGFNVASFSIDDSALGNSSLSKVLYLSIYTGTISLSNFFSLIALIAFF